MGVVDALREVFQNPDEQKPTPRIRAVEKREGVLIVRLQGKVGTSMGEAQSIGENELVSVANGEGSVVIDFAGTREIDFTTVAMLVQALRERAAANGRIGIINAPPKLRAEIEIAKLERLLPVYSSEGRAVRAMADEATRARKAHVEGRTSRGRGHRRALPSQ